MTGQCGQHGIGIVSDVVLQRHWLQVATGKFGLEVSFSGGPERLIDYPGFPEASLWLVTLEDEADHPALFEHLLEHTEAPVDRKSTRLNSSHVRISYAVFCL